MRPVRRSNGSGSTDQDDAGAGSEFIDDDELVEVTPLSIRIRKRHLTENDRKRAMRGAKEE